LTIGLEGIQSFKQWLIACLVSFDADTMLVIENTGVYHRQLWSFCTKYNIPIHIGNAAHIKWSLGITRGKNDINASLMCVNRHQILSWVCMPSPQTQNCL